MTQVTIVGEDFLIDGRPTYAGRHWRGQRVEGLLLNSRMVQATFDDLNPATRDRWRYPDTNKWDPERNLQEFLAMLPIYRQYGLLGITVNLQGGSPEGYSKAQPWDNSAYTAEGDLRAEFMERLRQILDLADQLGMVVIVGCFYFGQDERLADEAAVQRAVAETVRWLLAGGWENLLLEINNECDVPHYEHEILQPARVHELILVAKEITADSRRLLVGTSFRGRSVPTDAVVAASDFLLLHGNGVTDPAFIAEMIAQTRALPSYRPMPIVFNEDDHFAFDQEENNFAVAVVNHASWGYFDPGEGVGGAGAHSDYVEGYQLVPVNWGINTPRKQQFFQMVAEIAGVEVPPRPQ